MNRHSFPPRIVVALGASAAIHVLIGAALWTGDAPDPRPPQRDDRVALAVVRKAPGDDAPGRRAPQQQNSSNAPERRVPQEQKSSNAPGRRVPQAAARTETAGTNAPRRVPRETGSTNGDTDVATGDSASGTGGGGEPGTPGTEGGTGGPATAGSGPATNAPDAPEVDLSALKRDYALRVRKAVADRFRYPQAARGRALRGQVVLTVLVDARGRVAGVRVQESSGEELLDTAAVSSAGALANLPPPPGGALNVQVPVLFRM